MNCDDYYYDGEEILIDDGYYDDYDVYDDGGYDQEL